MELYQVFVPKVSVVYITILMAHSYVILFSKLTDACKKTTMELSDTVMMNKNK